MVTAESQRPFIHEFRSRSGRCYVLDVNTSEIVEVAPCIWDVLRHYPDVDVDHPPDELAARYTSPEIREALAAIRAAQTDGLFLPTRPTRIRYPYSKEWVRKRLGSHVGQLILCVTQDCNLRCRYCVFSDMYPFTPNWSAERMPDSVAQAALQYFLGVSKHVKQPWITFYGGEPLLHARLIRSSVEWIEAHKERGRVYNYALTTNGTMLAGWVADFLVQHDFDVTVSLDGPQSVHDRNRKTMRGQGTFETIVRNLRALRDKYPDYYPVRIRFNTVTTSPYDYQQLDTFFRDSDLFDVTTGTKVSGLARGGTFSQTLSPPEERRNVLGITELEERFFRRCVRGDIATPESEMEERLPKAIFEPSITDVYIRQAAKHLPKTFHPGGICVPGERRLFVSADGRFYPCEKVNHNCDSFDIGSVTTGVDVDKVWSLIQHYTRLTRHECRDCWACRMCRQCFVDAEAGAILSAEAKLESCRRRQRQLDATLTRVVSICEENPHAFDYMKDLSSS